ncbi:AfsR/SARP family transcriptional regulator [Amycolatopsis minnesotensis]|uniref:BTAD domain-containing putative transcriptional regulator n=1 Tax=Amycolatopsis minnesotensis TaxID=337894 RepID=A0ABN2Q2C5_9PSEU
MAEADLRFRVLGPVQLVAGGQPVPIGGPGVRGLLAMLALEANRIVALDRIIDALWDHDPPATARTIVHGNVSALRRSLRSVQNPDGEIRIDTAAPGYRLVVSPERIDVYRARRLLEAARGRPPGERVELLAEASALWEGPSLVGVPDGLRAPELADLRLAVRGELMDAQLALGKHTEVITELSQVVRDDPLAERSVGQLMRALYFTGRRADALQAYRRTARFAVETLGIGPGPELHDLHDRILNDELVPSTELSTRRAAPRAGAPAQLPSTVPVLVGRTADLGWLDEQLARSGEGGGAVAVVTGTAGIGKSALVVSWAHRVSPRFPDGVLFAALRGFSPEDEPLTPDAALAQFLRGLGVTPAEIPGPAEERIALYRSLLAERTVLVVLDDARDADQVRPLLPPGSRSMAVVTSRSRLDGLAVSHVAKARVLGTLPSHDAVQVIEELSGPGDYDLNRALANLCGHLPLALRVAGARLAASPQWTVSDLVGELANERTRLAGFDFGTETSVRAAFDASYRELAPAVAATARVLGTVVGESISPQLTALLAGLTSTEARRHLRALAAHHLLTETSKDVFAPHDDLVRLYLRELGEVAFGEQERAELLSRTATYYLAVADRARRRLRPVTFPADFTALVSEQDVPPLDSVDAALDWFATNWPNLMAMLESVPPEYAWQLAAVMHDYRVVRPLRGEWRKLVELGMKAAVAAGSETGRGRMLVARCALALTFERPEGSLPDAEEALAIARRTGDESLWRTAEIHACSALIMTRNADEALMRLRPLVDATVQKGELALQVRARTALAYGERYRANYDEAIDQQLASLRIDREFGDDAHAAVSLDNLAGLHLAARRYPEAERYAREAIGVSVSRGFVLREGVTRATLARILRAVGDSAGAREQFTLSVELRERANTPGQVTTRPEPLSGGS